MKIGDPRKALLLGAVALAIVGVAVFRALPGGSPGAASGPEAGTPEPTKTGNAALPDNVFTDPFFHPKLAGASKGGEEGSSTSAGTTGRPAQGSLRGPLPGAMLGPGPLTVTPEETTGDNQESEQTRSKRGVVVKAILSVGRSVAMISVGGAPPVARARGDVLFEGVKVIAINDDSVTLRTQRGRVTLTVGKQVDL